MSAKIPVLRCSKFGQAHQHLVDECEGCNLLKTCTSYREYLVRSETQTETAAICDVEGPWLPDEEGRGLEGAKNVANGDDNGGQLFDNLENDNTVTCEHCDAVRGGVEMRNLLVDINDGTQVDELPEPCAWMHFWTLQGVEGVRSIVIGTIDDGTQVDGDGEFGIYEFLDEWESKDRK
jgi:hypothetical protein